jgi:1-phosphatidylinositol phosphodiesterase
MATRIFLILCYLLSLLIVTSRCQSLYNWNPTSMRNQTWLAALDYGLPLREMSIVGTQNSVVFDSCFLITGPTQQRQANSLQVQLESGIRAIDIHVKHLNNQFQISDRGCAQGTSFNQVLTTVKNFLSTYPS